MSIRAKNATEAIFQGLESCGGSRPKLAKRLGINHTHIYLAAPVNGGGRKITPTLREALEEAGWIPRPPTRIRIAADLYDDHGDPDVDLARSRRQALRRYIDDMEDYESWSDYVRTMADDLRKMYERRDRQNGG